MINSIDRWVVSHALAWYAIIRPARLMQTTPSINLSGMSITDTRQLSHIGAEIRKYVYPRRYCQVLRLPKQLLFPIFRGGQFYPRVASSGLPFCTRRFGSVPSCLPHLKNLPVVF
jgi:hypothetical protein